MSAKSNDQGRAFEIACLRAIHEALSDSIGSDNVIIEENSSYFASLRAWDNTADEYHDMILTAARAMAEKLIELEPSMTENRARIRLILQKDEAGENGDVRDILIVRSDSGWEIGLSVKHNHFAVKHSRLSGTIDFGKKWYGIPCSEEYWSAVRPIFSYLKAEKSKKTKWSELENKDDDIYLPLLNAFLDELKRANELDSDFPRRMVEYLLGEYDFYKVISVDSKRETEIQPFNLRGKLNLYSGRKPAIIIPVAELPDEFIAAKMKKDSKTTAELYLNNGWQFNFRIHNASTVVENSLKFDVQLIGMPTAVVTIICKWK